MESLLQSLFLFLQTCNLRPWMLVSQMYVPNWSCAQSTSPGEARLGLGQLHAGLVHQLTTPAVPPSGPGGSCWYDVSHGIESHTYSPCPQTPELQRGQDQNPSSGHARPLPMEQVQWKEVARLRRLLAAALHSGLLLKAPLKRV